MSNSISRSYNSKDVDMLTAADTIITNCINNRAFLEENRPLWKATFFQDIKDTINSAFSNILGIDNASQLRQITLSLINNLSNAKNLITKFKIQLEADFSKDKQRLNELLNLLGFKDLYKKAMKNDQEAMVQLLNRFKTNMTQSLKDEITAKGMNPQTIDYITAITDVIKDLNTQQESTKGTKKELTEQAISQLNEIYSQVSSIAKIARNLYKGDNAKQELFSFNKILQNLNNEKKLKNSPEQPS